MSGTAGATLLTLPPARGFALAAHHSPPGAAADRPLGRTTFYERERCGELPRRFNLTPHCVVGGLAEVVAWTEQRKQAPRHGLSKPDVHLRQAGPLSEPALARNEAERGSPYLGRRGK